MSVENVQVVARVYLLLYQGSLAVKLHGLGVEQDSDLLLFVFGATTCYQQLLIVDRGEKKASWQCDGLDKYLGVFVFSMKRREIQRYSLKGVTGHSF